MHISKRKSCVKKYFDDIYSIHKFQNHVQVMHATAMIKMAKSRTMVRNVWPKLIYIYAYNLSNLLLQICFNNIILLIMSAKNCNNMLKFVKVI